MLQEGFDFFLFFFLGGGVKNTSQLAESIRRCKWNKFKLKIINKKVLKSQSEQAEIQHIGDNDIKLGITKSFLGLFWFLQVILKY